MLVSNIKLFIYIYILFALYHYSSLENIEYTSLCYTVNPVPSPFEVGGFSSHCIGKETDVQRGSVTYLGALQNRSGQCQSPCYQPHAVLLPAPALSIHKHHDGFEISISEYSK